MSIWDKLKGTQAGIWIVGLLGPRLKNNSGVLEIRLNDDSGFQIARAAPPVGKDDVVTLQFLETLSGFVIIAGQANTSSSLGTNTSTPQVFVVTTAGTGANIGDLLYDNGTGSGPRIIITAAARTIFTPIALIGGTQTFNADSLYTWDTIALKWVLVGDIGSVTGPVRTLRIPFSNVASVSSVFQMPANTRVIRAWIDFTTLYTAGVTAKLGITGTLNQFLDTGDNSPQTTDLFKATIQDANQSVGGSAISGVVTLAGTLTSGAGAAFIEFTNPNA